MRQGLGSKMWDLVDEALLRDLPAYEWSKTQHTSHARQFIADVLSSDAWSRIDPHVASSPRLTRRQIHNDPPTTLHHEHLTSHLIADGSFAVHRARPIVNGLRVHGADRIIVRNEVEGTWVLGRVPRFRLPEAGSDGEQGKPSRRRRRDGEEVPGGYREGFVLSPEEAINAARISAARVHENRSKNSTGRGFTKRETASGFDKIAAEPVFYALPPGVWNRWVGPAASVQSNSNPHSSFMLSTAYGATASLPQPSDSTATDNSDASEHTSADLRPAYRIVDPNLPSSERSVRYVDAETGFLLAEVPLVHHASEKGYVFGETFVVGKLPGARPPLTDLLDVTVPITSNGGMSIRGKDFRIFGTCQAFRCANGTGRTGNRTGLDGSCTDEGTQCVNLPDSFTSNGFNLPEGVNTSPLYFTADGRYIDLDRNWTADGFPDGRILVKWTEATIFAPRIRRPEPGAGEEQPVWGSDTKFSEYYGSEFNDTFAELQAYHSMTMHMKFMRELIGDPNFCLIGKGPNCTDVDPVQNISATPWTRQLHVAVNYVDLPSTSEDGLDLLDQLELGRGKTADNPILVSGVQPYGDAFFSGSGFQPPLDPPNSTLDAAWFGDCKDKDCAMISKTPFSYIAMGQNLRFDWSLNQCIVFHELTHAFVSKFIPDLPGFAWTERGLQSDPGAMNEAWADYFASIHCGVSNFFTSYNGQPRRNLNNNVDCSFMVGGVHNDGQIFSGALWTLRKSLPDDVTRRKFDQIVLTALTLGQPTDGFASQFRLIHTLLKNSTVPQLASLAPIAYKEFDRREFSCQRVTNYQETMDSTFGLPGATATPVGVSTLPNQLIFTPSTVNTFTASSTTAAAGNDASFTGYKPPISSPPFLVGAVARCPIPGDPNGATKDVPLAWQEADLDKVRYGFGSIDVTFRRTDELGNRPFNVGADGKALVYLWLAHGVRASMTMFSSDLRLKGWTSVSNLTVGYLGAAVAGLGLLALLIGCGVFISLYVRRLMGKKARVLAAAEEKSVPVVVVDVLPQSQERDEDAISSHQSNENDVTQRRTEEEATNVQSNENDVTDGNAQLKTEEEATNVHDVLKERVDVGSSATGGSSKGSTEADSPELLPNTTVEKSSDDGVTASQKVASDDENVGSPAKNSTNSGTTKLDKSSLNKQAAHEGELQEAVVKTLRWGPFFPRERAVMVFSLGMIHLLLVSLLLAGSAVSAIVADRYVPARTLGVRWGLAGVLITAATLDLSYIVLVFVISCTAKRTEGAEKRELLSVLKSSRGTWPFFFFAIATVILIAGVSACLCTASLYPSSSTEAGAGAAYVFFLLGFVARALAHGWMLAVQ
ncbi:hypothetical protein HDU96_009401, partial [Phlyctochytrium bullatum]